MRKSLLAAGFVGMLSALPMVSFPIAAHAGNSAIEANLQSYGDLSMFYQALLNTGVINQLTENQNYTIFAPTNAAFSEIRPANYPCFYSANCRPQIGVLLNNHIVLGRYDLKENFPSGGPRFGQKQGFGGEGLQTMSNRQIFIEEAYPGSFMVNGAKILSKSEIGGNIIYRIDSVITNPQEMSQFQTVSYVPAPATGVVTTTEKTVTCRSHIVQPRTTYPAGTMAPAGVASDGGETTTVIQTYTTQQ